METKKTIYLVVSSHTYDFEIDQQIVGIQDSWEDAVHILSMEYNITRNSMSETYGEDNLEFDDVVDEYENWHKITSPNMEEIYQIEVLEKTIPIEISIK